MSSLNGEFPDDDMELLRSVFPPTIATGGIASEEGESEGEGNDDLQFLRSIKKRFAVPMDKPTDCSDSDEDNYQTLRAIDRRFATYNDGRLLKDKFEDDLHIHEQVGATILDSEKETSNSFVERTNCVDDAGGSSDDLVEWNGAGGSDDVAGLPCKIPYARTFFAAIQKNSSCQELIRKKMKQMEARMEEFDKLIKRVIILKDFQVACKKRIGRSLSQKRDLRVRLISLPKLWANMKMLKHLPNEKNINIHASSYKGPPENVHVSDYMEALAEFGVPSKKKWTKKESENLVNGVIQQFQETLFSEAGDGAHGWNNVDSVLKSINDHGTTPAEISLFSRRDIKWKHLAETCVRGRSGAECKARFMSSEDPLINQSPWTATEDKNLLHFIQENGLSRKWEDVAASLGTNRTPFQCLARYQRSLNASILRREWSSEEDDQLLAAVETYGESNWQFIASTMEGRTGTQCSNRWLKTLNPAKVRSGKWTLEEDKRLKVAATLFRPKSWKKVARCVPGRTHVQCRERWVNSLDPSLNKAEWSEEEDLKLEEAIAKHGYCWSKVSTCIPHRTDNMCWRRWKVLFPSEVASLQSARKIRKAALISNFVDRESEKPALGHKDFVVPDAFRITGKKKGPRKQKIKIQHNEKDGNEEFESMEGKYMHREGRRRRRSSRSNAQGRNQALDVEFGDDVTLAQFYRKLKRRKTDELT